MKRGWALGLGLSLSLLIPGCDEPQTYQVDPGVEKPSTSQGMVPEGPRLRRRLMLPAGQKFSSFHGAASGSNWCWWVVTEPRGEAQPQIRYVVFGEDGSYSEIIER